MGFCFLGVLFQQGHSFSAGGCHLRLHGRCLIRNPMSSYLIFATVPNGEFSEPIALENNMEMQHDEPVQEDMNDVPVDEDEEVTELIEDSDDESDSEFSLLTASLVEDGNVGDTLIGLKESRLRYQV